MNHALFYFLYFFEKSISRRYRTIFNPRMASTTRSDRSQTPVTPALPVNVTEAAFRFRAGEDAELAYHLQNRGSNLKLEK